MKKISRILSVIGGIALIIVLFVPMWKIELMAPQYPEGLIMKIYPHKVGGDVEIINGLNHYIGMKVIKQEDFIEFKVLPYIIGAFAALCFAVALVNRRWMLYSTLVLFFLFGILAMYDFWRWLYDYGHNLDPMAAIQVPGMAYQPPLIGYKELLNFGAFSIPDTGGWLFLVAGTLLLSAVAIEWRAGKKQLR